MTLGEFLSFQLEVEEPWHCSTMQADWCITQGYSDFSHKWRHSMSDEECNSIDNDRLLEIWEESVSEYLSPTDTPKNGDIGVISFLEHNAGGIFIDNKWAIRIKRGIGFIANERVRVLKVWSVCQKS